MVRAAGGRSVGRLFLSAALLGLCPSLAAGEPDARPAREILEEARARGATDPAEIARAIRPASVRRIAELRVLLADADPYARTMAVGALSLLGDHPVQALIGLLDDTELGVRRAAEDALVVAGPPAVAALGEVLQARSCLSEAVKASVRILGRIGDPAGIPYLTGFLVTYRKGGFPQAVGMEALLRIGTPAAIGQMLQLISYRELGEEASLALMGVDPTALLGTVDTLLADSAEDAETRFFYAMQLNEILGTEAAAPVMLGFFARIAEDTSLPPATRTKGKTLRNLFSAPREDSDLYRKPLTRQRLDVLFAATKEDEESPYLEERRRREKEMDAIRAERRAAKPPPGGLVLSPMGFPIMPQSRP